MKTTTLTAALAVILALLSTPAFAQVQGLDKGWKKLSAREER